MDTAQVFFYCVVEDFKQHTPYRHRLVLLLSITLIAGVYPERLGFPVSVPPVRAARRGGLQAKGLKLWKDPGASQCPARASDKLQSQYVF